MLPLVVGCLPLHCRQRYCCSGVTSSLLAAIETCLWFGKISVAGIEEWYEGSDDAGRDVLEMNSVL